MERKAFKMYLVPGNAEEYRRRHNEIDKEVAQLLKDMGIGNYSIYLDEDTNVLIGVLEVEKPEALEELKSYEAMKKWWQYMSDIMVTNPDRSPKLKELREMFFLK